MAICQKIQSKRRQVCVGDLDTRISIRTRDIAVPGQCGVDYGEDFQEQYAVWAMHQTVGGETIFDESNIERVLTDVFYIRYLTGITSELWVHLDDQYYRILTVEHLDRRKEFIKLNCTIRGDDALQVNYR